MLVREEAGGGLVAITQPAHAALAGRLAAAWDDDLTEDLRTAVAHHDDVWAWRDGAPPLNVRTGRPESFVELSTADRAAVWGRVTEVAAPLGPAAQLWVLRHAERLHASYDDAALKAMTAGISAAAAALVDALRVDHPGRFDDPELARGSSLLGLLDTVSLRVCLGVRDAVDAGVLRLTPTPGGPIAVAPWPFRGQRVEDVVEARRLPGRLDDQAALDAAWAAAEPVALPVVLVPA